MHTISLPTFAGPLDLLLRLIEQAELDITTIALAQVADQYLVQVRAMEAPDPGALAEFVSVAARLLLIKSRALLPRPPARDEVASADPDAEALANQLRAYQQFKHVAATLREWQDQGRRTFLRTAPLPVASTPQQVRLNHQAADLVAALERRLRLLKAPEESTPLSLPPRLTVRAVAERVRERLARNAWFAFEDLLASISSRQELIVTFWAVLELRKRHAIVIEQTDLFGPISIGRGAAGTAELAWDAEAELSEQTTE